jgi:ATP-dependent helicase/nuclease subunit B
MPVEILLAPVGAGKTAFVLEQLARTLESQPFARIWVLVSGKRQEDAFRQRLIEKPDGRSVYFNVEFFTFYQLYHRLLNIAQQPPRMLDNAARFGLLRAILTDLKAQNQLPVYGAIAETPGFVRIMADFIYELKQNQVAPDKLAQAAQSPKDHEIAAIYARYQDHLRQHELVDREGEGWLALEALKPNPHIARDVDLLLVDGYDQFTPLQARLLMQVAARARQTFITLTTVPEREDTIGRRFTEAFEQLKRYSPDGLDVSVQTRSEAQETRPAALRQVLDQIFRRDFQSCPAGENIVLIEAPDAESEAAAVLRRVKRVLADGARPDDVLIALRDWPRYAGHFATLGRAYGLPLALHGGEPLIQNPAVMLLLNIISLHETDFRRRDLLDVLRAPYLNVPGLGPEQADLLDRLSQQLIITGGASNWLEAITRAAQSGALADEEDSAAPEPLLTADAARQLHDALATFFAAVTPPAAAPLAAYIHWLHALIGPDEPEDADDPPDSKSNPPEYTLSLPAGIRAGAVPEMVARDLAALDELTRVLRSLLAAETLLQTLDSSRTMNRALFLFELRAAVSSAAVNRGSTRTGRVLVTTVTDARGLPHRHVFIPGLSEGIFPAPLSEDPLYLDSERLALRAREITLETQAERGADDGLFYQLIGQARETLTLSRPTVQDGAPWVASHLWRGVTAVLSDAPAIIEAHRVRLGDVVPPESAASFGEALLALADGLNRPTPLPAAAQVYNWLLAEQPAPWLRVDHARRVELRRMARGLRHDRFSGRLRDAALIAQIADQLGPQRTWSASQLNEFGTCPFRFFARRLLHLEALEEPEDGLDQLKLGTIYHDILEQTYRELTRRGCWIVPEHLDEALAVLREAAAPLLDAAPQRLGFADNALWAQERAVLLRRLEAFIRADFSDDNPAAKKLNAPARRPFAQELPFSEDGAPNATIPIDLNGQTDYLRVRGRIDRLDETSAGVIIIDYKSGSTAIPVDDMRSGRNYQMMVYLHAAEQILAAQYGPNAPEILGGLFWHLRSRDASGALRLDEEGCAALAQAQVHLGDLVAAARRGDFSVRPRRLDHGKCIHYCDYARLCRIASTHRFKPEDEA